MQDAFVRDMFNISDVNNPRYNGHVQISSCGKVAGGKRDRKGCTKGKIEAIMKNNSVRPKVCVNTAIKKSISSGSNHSLHSNHNNKTEQEEDPYTFTEPEPQVLSLYQPSGSSIKKGTVSKSSSANMVCQDRNKQDHSVKNVVKVIKTPEGTSKMNKLQADIARNKVIGKRRKIVEQTPQRLHEWSTKRDPGKVCISAKRKSTWKQERNSKHELLERIYQVKNSLNVYTRDLYPLGLELSDSDSDSEPTAVYERSWFCKTGEHLPRERRLEETRNSLRRRLHHTVKAVQLSELPPRSLFSAVIAAARRFPSATAAILDPSLNLRAHLPINRRAMFLVRGEKCSYPEGCNSQALPCTRHCVKHIMYNVDQRLFSHCTAKYPDNTQCTTPVFDVLHHLPLCHKHASSVSLDSHNRTSDSRSGKKVSRKSRMLGSSKRNNKKRKKLVPVPPPKSSPELRISSPIPISVPESILEPEHVPIDPQLQENIVFTENVVEEVPVEEVLAIASMDPAELASQATRLLEEHDLTNVLNQLSADAFNDLFIDKNGEYEPTREETEELERALEQVNNDVRSLETLTRSLPPLLQLPPLEALLDDDSTPFPAFHNGFPPPQTHQS